jgi:glycosyltransferase involved in cell wall biosynthesis
MSNILIYGDAVDSHSGLGRISRDLCLLASSTPPFRVASFGRGAVGSSKFPWLQYSFSQADQWGENQIRQVWNNFTANSNSSPNDSGGGQILTVWDASRLLWFSGLASTGDPDLDVFVGSNRTWSKWGYFMVDATGPDGLTLPYESREVMRSYDRVVVASEWAAQVARRSGVECEWIPHPIDGGKFYHGDLGHSHHQEYMEVSGRVVLGCVMTNQARKDWPTAFAIAASLAKSHKSRFLFWVHTDSAASTPGSYWNLHALAIDYGLPPECLRITLTGTMTDSMMAAFYNACDATIVCSGGEGFGYPIAESLACGCPCITQDYAAGAELTREEWRVPVNAFKLETSHNVLRAVHSPYGWVRQIEEAIEQSRVEGEEWRQELAASMEYLHMKNLKSVWRRWLLEGIGQ